MDGSYDNHSITALRKESGEDFESFANKRELGDRDDVMVTLLALDFSGLHESSPNAKASFLRR